MVVIVWRSGRQPFLLLLVLIPPVSSAFGVLSVFRVAQIFEDVFVAVKTSFRSIPIVVVFVVVGVHVVLGAHPFQKAVRGFVGMIVRLETMLPPRAKPLPERVLTMGHNFRRCRAVGIPIFAFSLVVRVFQRQLR